MGNRGGQHHDPRTRKLVRRWATRRWIACTLHFKGWHHEAMGEGYTSLFFLDEVTALSAGHRPCFCCRRRDATEFLERAGFLGQADAFDILLHGQRISRKERPRLMENQLRLPDGVVFEEGGQAYAVRGRYLLLWSPGGYAERKERESARQVSVLTPAAIIAVLAGGYRPAWHPSAGDD
jgi:hypothetical protein